MSPDTKPGGYVVKYRWKDDVKIPLRIATEPGDNGKIIGPDGKEIKLLDHEPVSAPTLIERMQAAKKQAEEFPDGLPD